MKYLKLFEQFLILEAELKSSQFLQAKIEEIYGQAIKELENEQKERASKKGIISRVKDWFTDNDDEWTKFFEEEIEQPLEIISCKVSDVIYDRPKLQLGSVILEKGLATNFKYDSDFVSQVKSVVTTKKLSKELKDIYDSCELNLAVFIYYKGSDISLLRKSISFGSLGSYSEETFLKLIKQKANCGIWSIRLNIHKDCRDESQDTIRHELQHLTQKACSLYLSIAEEFISELNSGKKEIDLSSKLNEIYINSQKKGKVGLAKTKTGNRQRSEDAKDIESLKVSYKKVYNDDLDLDSEKEMKKAKFLQYIADDNEYKPWLTDKVNQWIDDISKETKLFTSGKSEDDCAVLVAKAILEDDDEISILKKLRKESASDILKLATLRIKKLGLVKKKN